MSETADVGTEDFSDELGDEALDRMGGRICVGCVSRGPLDPSEGDGRGPRWGACHLLCHPKV